jgi:hypothetical protein
MATRFVMGSPLGVEGDGEHDGAVPSAERAATDGVV